MAECFCGVAIPEGQAVCRECLEKARENYLSIHTGGPLVHYDVSAALPEKQRAMAVRMINGAKQSKRHCWTAPGRARVTHPRHGETVVPCRSKLAATQCAAEVWGCGWAGILDAEVRALEGLNHEKHERE